MENGEEKGGDVKVTFFPGSDFLKLRLVVGGVAANDLGFRDSAGGRDGIVGLGSGLRVGLRDLVGGASGFDGGVHRLRGRRFWFLDADRLGSGGDLLPAAWTEGGVLRQLCATVVTEHDTFLLSLFILETLFQNFSFFSTSQDIAASVLDTINIESDGSNANDNADPKDSKDRECRP